MKHGIRFSRWLCLLLVIVAALGITIAAAADTNTVAADGLVLEDMIILQPADATVVEKTPAKNCRFI